MREYNNALYYFGCCEDINPDEPKTYFYIGESLFHLKSYFDAKIKLEYYLKLKPNDEYA